MARGKKKIGPRKRKGSLHKRQTGRDSKPLTREQENRASHALTHMRDGESLAAASRAEGVKPSTVRKYAGPAIRRRKGKYIYEPRRDRALRNVKVPTSKGDAPASVSRGNARRIAQYRTARKQALSRDKETRQKGLRQLRKFRGRKFRAKVGGKWKTLKFETRPKKIDQMRRQGKLDLKNFYEIRGRR